MLLTESLNDSQNYQKKLIFLEYEKEKYPIGPLNFLKDNFSTISSSPALSCHLF